MKNLRDLKEDYVSDAQRKAVWANKADGGKGHPDNKRKSKKENVRTADRKPEIYTDPQGKKRVRMVATDRNIIVKEAEMTDAQKKRREEIVLGMKDQKDRFKRDYGDRWKEVMYATATKMAMKESAGHYMYKDGKKVWVKTAADHDKYTAKGYTMKEEVIHEEKDLSTDRLKMLVRLGLMDKKDMTKIVRSIGKMKEDKPVSPADRKILFDLLNELIGMITGDEQMFQKAKKAVREEKDPNEYDREGDMLKNQLRQICSANEKLMKMVGDDDNLPEWVQNKVTKATDYITSVRDYLESEKNEQVHEKVKVDELSRGTLINYSVKSRGDALKHSRLFKGAKTTAQDDERVKKRMRGDALAGKKLDRLDKKIGESKGKSFKDITGRKNLSPELARKIVRDSETAIDRMLAKKQKKKNKNG